MDDLERQYDLQHWEAGSEDGSENWANENRELVNESEKVDAAKHALITKQINLMITTLQQCIRHPTSYVRFDYTMQQILEYVLAATDEEATNVKHMEFAYRK